MSGPEIEEYGDVIFVVMHLPELQHGRLVIGELDVFRGRQLRALRAQPQQPRGPGRAVARRTGSEAVGARSGFVLYALMDAVVDRYFPIIDTLERQLEKIEESIFRQGSARENVERLYALKRQVTLLHHGVAPMMEAVGKLCSGRVPGVCLRSQITSETSSTTCSASTPRSTPCEHRAPTAIRSTLSMVTIRRCRDHQAPGRLGGLFGVATAFAGIWGMNFAHMPELESPFGYPAALLAIATALRPALPAIPPRGWI